MWRDAVFTCREVSVWLLTLTSWQSIARERSRAGQLRVAASQMLGNRYTDLWGIRGGYCHRAPAGLAAAKGRAASRGALSRSTTMASTLARRCIGVFPTLGACDTQNTCCDCHCLFQPPLTIFRLRRIWGRAEPAALDQNPSKAYAKMVLLSPARRPVPS